MSEERRRRQQGRLEVGVLAKLKKYWKKLLALLGIGAVGDLLKETARSRFMDWSLLRFGKYGRWIIGNPSSLLTIAVAAIVAWIIWIALTELVGKYEFTVLGEHGQKIIQPRVSRNFLAALVAVSTVTISAVGYGEYVVLTVPTPVIVTSSSAWFKEKFRGGEVYAVVNLENCSDLLLPVHIHEHVSVWGKPVPDENMNGGDTDMTFAPWKRNSVRFYISPSLSPDVMAAYKANAIMIYVDASYKDGTTPKSYKYTGRIMADSLKYCPTCDGNIDVVESDNY